jgi:23S rRNA (cytosine1962-C5)-methyltransferase
LECARSAPLLDGIFPPTETNAFRLVHTANWQLDKFGDFLLSQSPQPVPPSKVDGNVYHKITTPHVRGKSATESSPQLIAGVEAPTPFTARENNIQYEINFNEGYSVGIFLDQRDNRRRLINGYVAPDFFLSLKDKEVLNTFAYTCAFSVCAALAGARVTSLDLSRKYLDWGKRNFQRNNLDPEKHDFIYGDVFDWMKRLGKKGRQFDLILLDPPTFSKSKQSGIFRAEEDYPRLVGDALKLLRPNGVLFASSNAARWEPEDFMRKVTAAIASSRRKSVRQQYIPQPPDFPISREEPAYLKTAWFQVA